MILHFPSLDALRLALTSGVIPEAVRATEARFAFADDRSLWVQSEEPLSEKGRKDLRRLGVQFPADCAIALSQTASHWLQMLPLAAEQRALEVGDKTPILFEMSAEGQLAEIAMEILRLGNDRQSFRFLEADGSAKALLRVVGPPYYSLLRAVDRAGQDGAPIAYREAAPRVWVQVGFAHPLAEHIRPPAGQCLLMRPPHVWEQFPEGKWRDIYEVVEFALAPGKTLWRDAELPARIAVPVRLTRAGASDAAELWVLREPGIAQLEELVRTSDNELIARLAFAVGEKDGARVVVLRVRPSKSTPPVLVLDGLALRSYLRIPTLFLPVGMVLHPPLRRDAVIRLLADDKTRVTWLAPGPAGSFTPESLSDDAFRPLSEWVDYVLEHDHQAIKTWLGASQFQFEGFICKDEIPKKKPPREPRDPKQPLIPDPTADAPIDEPAAKKGGAEKKKPAKPAPTFEAEIRAEPSELQQRLRELEESFSALAAPLEDPHRQTLWCEMARLNGMLQQPGDAAICWGNALWEMPTIPPELPADWLRLEARPPVSWGMIARAIQSETATHATVRLVAAYLIGAAADVKPHLATLQPYLERHEALLGTRVVWLAWHAIYRLSGDVLALARARDRLLERLHLHGLTPELDLPGFLRFAGAQANSRFRMVRDQVVRLRRQVQDWAKTGANPVPATHAYIDLVFAFGLARLGESSEARRLLASAAEELASADEVHSWLYGAFEHRVQQALDGKSALERLPGALLERMDAIEHADYLEHLSDAKQREEVKYARRMLRLKIDRMREKSRILEPLETIDAYRGWRGRFDDELTQTLAGLTALHDREELIERLRKLLAGKQKFKRAQRPEARILLAALELAPRLGQAFGEELLTRAWSQLGKSTDVDESAHLLEKSLLLAGHLDRKNDVDRLAAKFLDLSQGPGPLPHDRLTGLFSGSFRNLRKFGLRERVAELLQRLEKIVQAEETAQNRASSYQVSNQLAHRLTLLLELAGGWFYFGEDAKARGILDRARDALFGKDLIAVDRVKVASAYFAALGQAPMEFARARIMEVFRKLEGVYDVWTTQSHYSLTRFSVVEAMMLAIISDDFTLDRAARRRLDDDEYLIRRRIHRDVRDAMSAAGT